MFDIRPVDQSGALDWKRIGRVAHHRMPPQETSQPAVSSLKPAISPPTPKIRVIQRIPQGLPYRSEVIQLGKVLPSEHVPLFPKTRSIVRSRPAEPRRPIVSDAPLVSPEPPRESVVRSPIPRALPQPSQFYHVGRELQSRRQSTLPKRSSRMFRKPRFTFFRTSASSLRMSFSEKRSALIGFLRFSRTFAWSAASLCVVLTAWGSVTLFHQGMRMKGEVLGVSQDGYEHMLTAMQDIKRKDFDHSALSLTKAYDDFSRASEVFGEWNETLIDLSRFIPGASKLASGKNSVEAGKHIASAAKSLNEVLRVLSDLKNPLDTKQRGVSLLQLLEQTQKQVASAAQELSLAQEALEKVKLDDIPEEKRDRFLEVRNRLPEAIEAMNGFTEHEQVFAELLGANGPRKYLFLFQNNNEMRATGGFIGSYGLMDISDGHIRNFFVDGIFNPDGQLKEDIVPPAPLQKISAGWSLHDSNWFPDFPTSAEKSMFFYEKTGGPTVDGVITLTPVMIQKLLALTGPIRMDAYDVTLNTDNFLEETQREVEVDYDKTENKPKQILADLAPILLEKLLNGSDAKTLLGTAKVLEDGLKEKHVLLYARNQNIQAILDQQGWSGRVLDASRDYLSVINTNINGYKTDGVVDESIHHEAAIQEDGSVIDTVTITRKHNGGYMPQEWWNKVNADYMRVYVPKGSQLISAEGYTPETIEPPLDYDRLGFRRDKEVQDEEEHMVVDEASGTKIYEESGKTVFANWVYVSPQETATVTYKYRLPFLVDPSAQEKESLDSYSVVYQKQSGSLGSRLDSSITFPPGLTPIWQSSENLVRYDGGFQMNTDLKVDRFAGVTFSSKAGD